MTSSNTYTYDYVRTHTATHLTEIILGTIGDLLADLGLDLMQFQGNWSVKENGIKAWIEEQSLEAVVLECFQPGGKVAPVIEFPVSYDNVGVADRDFTTSRARLARFRAKLDAVPRSSTYRLVCTYRFTPTDQPGWSDTTRADKSGLRSLNFGTLGAAPYASTGMTYHH